MMLQVTTGKVMPFNYSPDLTENKLPDQDLTSLLASVPRCIRARASACPRKPPPPVMSTRMACSVFVQQEALVRAELSCARVYGGRSPLHWYGPKTASAFTGPGFGSHHMSPRIQLPGSPILRITYPIMPRRHATSVFQMAAMAACQASTPLQHAASACTWSSTGRRRLKSVVSNAIYC